MGSTPQRPENPKVGFSARNLPQKWTCKSRVKVMCFGFTLLIGFSCDTSLMWTLPSLHTVFCIQLIIFPPLKSYTMRKAAMVVAPQPSGGHSKNWIFLCICAFHITNPFLFAVSKQAPSHIQRQKEGLYVNIPVARSCSYAVNYPGIKIEPTKEEKLLGFTA